MPELTIIHFGLLVLMLLAGLIGGWVLRADRCVREKMAVNASWQDQLESQQSEHNRLAEQNKSLMEQISQYQASQKDFTNRAKELSDSLKEAFARRDELQRQLKDARGNLEVAIAQRDRLKNKMQNQDGADQTAVLKDKDDKIFRLSRELTSWQSRVPPLVERFRERDQQAHNLEEELANANSRLRALEELVRSDNTRIEPLDADSLPDGGDASNEPIAMTSSHSALDIQDQIDAAPQEEESAFDPPEDNAEDETAFAAIFSSNDDAADEENESEPAEAENTTAAVTTGDRASNGAFATGAAGVDYDREKSVSDDEDDLKAIKGIGPSIERTLNDLGITHFRQLAEISEVDIDRVAQQLKGFRSRIYREDWIGQARDLHAQKNGGLS